MTKARKQVPRQDSSEAAREGRRMSENGKDIQVEDRGSLHDYRTEIPNMLIEMDLSFCAFKLYVVLKRVAGDNGKCFYTSRQLADKFNISMGAISKGKLELVKKKLITIQRGSKWTRDNITIVDIWPANFAYFADPQGGVAHKSDANACSQYEQEEQNERSGMPSEADLSVHIMNTPGHNMNTPVHDVNTKEEPIKEEPIKEEPNGDCRLQADAPANPDSWSDFLAALCWTCHGHQNTKALTESQLGALTSEAKRIRDMGYTIANLREWMERFWFKSWQWEKGRQCPKPNEVRSSIPILRDTASAPGRYSVATYEPMALAPLTPPSPSAALPLPAPLAPPTGLAATWATCRQELTPIFNGSSAWLDGSALEATDRMHGKKRVYRLTVTNRYSMDWLQRMGSVAICRTLSGLLRQPVTIDIVAATTEETPV